MRRVDTPEERDQSVLKAFELRKQGLLWKTIALRLGIAPHTLRYRISSYQRRKGQPRKPQVYKLRQSKRSALIHRMRKNPKWTWDALAKHFGRTPSSLQTAYYRWRERQKNGST